MTEFGVGTLVSAREREWIVLPDSTDDMLVLRPLGGSDDDIAAVFPAREQVCPAQFDPPDVDDLGDAQAAGMLRAALRVGFRSGAGPFRSLAGLAVEPRAYQLVPLMMALRQRTVRMLLSDDVGIGKTVEAGLIAAELIAQGSARRIAILCSPALTEQWQDELRTKFGIDAELVIASTAPRLERDLDYGKSLFEQHRNVVVSTDLIKSTRHRDDFVRHCPDLVIVDEAHTCVAADVAASRQTQLRYELLQRVAADADRHLILVTATPHSGKESAFRNLLGLVKPELATVDLESDAGRRTLAPHFVHRTRADVRQYLTVRDGLADNSLVQVTAFPSDRHFKDEPYRLDSAYRELLDDAIVYAREQVAVAGDRTKREARIAWWSAIALLRSLVSSPRAAAQTLRTRSGVSAATTAEEADVLGAAATRDLPEDDSSEGLDVVAGVVISDTDSNGVDQRLLELAQRASELEGPATDKKLATLTKQLKQLIADGYHPIVFCRYIPTAEYVAEHLTGKLGRKTVIRAVAGDLSPQQRLQRIEELAEAAGDDPAARRVLIATDCLSEGVNLQRYFDAVVHYDLAWNPTRHDQREGRVDRFGQERDTVRVVTLVGSDNIIDGKVLEVLIKKYRQIRKDIGIAVSVPDAAAAGVTDALVEWLLAQDGGSGQQGLFGLDELTVADVKAAELEAEWKSAAEREKASRSRFAQRTIRIDEVAREVIAIRDVLGGGDEIPRFVRTGLTALHGVLADSPDGSGDFTADLSGSPAGLRNSIAVAIGADPNAAELVTTFRVAAPVPRGESALVRTDPVVRAAASYVLDTALDDRVAGPRPARRAGVVRTRSVIARTTLLVVRYRFHLVLPSRNGIRDIVAEDARMVAFEGAPEAATWLTDDATFALLDAAADQNTDRAFARRTIERVLGGLTAVTDHIDARGQRLADELLDSHRRVRGASGEIVRGLRVSAQPRADILGVYVYLPAASAGEVA